jgi:hypothetical protein
MSVEWLNGKICTRVYKHYPENFTFEFGPAALSVACLWRIVAGGKVVLTSRDQGQQFGPPAPGGCLCGSFHAASAAPGYSCPTGRSLGRSPLGVRGWSTSGTAN